MLRSFVLAFALIALGCGGAARSAGAPTTASTHASGDGLEAQARAIVATVSKIRGLSPKQPVEIRSLDEDAFVRAFEDRLKRIEGPGDHPMVGSAVKARADLFLGFYDEGLKVIFVRRKLPKWARERTNPRALLAHEITHALQDQHFGLAKLTTLKEPDQRLAFLALIEGDAELVSIGFDAIEKKRSWRNAILRDSQADNLSADTMIRIGGFSPELMKAAPATREMTTFPYLSGRAFAGALFRAGGFGLIDKAFASPPDTTEQILHPDKYVEGERAVPVRDPVLPAGFTTSSTLTFGELLTRAVLERSYPIDQARLLASGWGGDRVALVKTPSGGEGVLWSSAWDSTEAAARFEEAVRNTAETGRGGAPDLVVRDGVRVAMIAGVPKPLQPALAKELLALPQAALALRPPVGRVAIPPPPPSLENRADLRGAVKNGVYVSRAMGLRADIPPGTAFATDRPSLQLVVVRRDPSLVTGALAFSSDPIEDAGEEIMHKAAVEGFVAKMPAGGGRPRLVSQNALHTPLGKGSERTWSLDRGALFFRTVLVPACDRLGAYMITMVWADDDGRRLLDAWLGSFRDDGAAASAMCRELKREAAE